MYENLLLLVVLSLGLVSGQNPATSDYKVIEEQRDEAPFKSKDFKKDTVNTDSLIIEAKKTVDLYNKTELKRAELNQKELSLLREEIRLGNQQGKLTKTIIQKVKARIRAASAKEYTLQVDSICQDKKSKLARVFSKDSCKKYNYSYFVNIDNKRYNLNTE